MLKLNVSYFSVLTCVFQREGKYRQDEDKLTPYTFVTCTTSKRQSLTEITSHCCVSYLCLQPSHHLRGTASIHKDIPSLLAHLNLVFLDSTSTGAQGRTRIHVEIIRNALLTESSNERGEETSHFQPRPDQPSESESPGRGARRNEIQTDLRPHSYHVCSCTTRTDVYTN